MRTMICLHQMDPHQQEKIRLAAPNWHIIFGRPKEIERKWFKEAEVICGWSSAIIEEGLKQESKLRWVQTWSAGVDKVPMDAFQSKGVFLTNASGVHPIPMTETAFAFMLSFARKVHTAIRNQHLKKWDNNPKGYFELHGKTLGIVGAGEIGAETARIGKAFGMNTIGVRRSGNPLPHIDRMLDMTGLDQLLAESDYVVNILPLTDETHRLFDEQKFKKMKPSSIFINIGRGASVCTEALMKALQEGWIAGAGVDVIDPEPLPEDHPLWTMENIMITPHTGGYTNLYEERVTEIFLENLQSYLTTGTPSRNVVDYHKQY